VQAKMVHSKAIIYIYIYINDANCFYRLLITKSSDSGSNAELKTIIWTGPESI
jgi:hypothetical protein